MRLAQVSSYVYREAMQEPAAADYLALHRTPERGNFWQSVTGGVEESDSSLMGAAFREVTEELQIGHANIRNAFDADYTFSFVDKKDGLLAEHVFGVEVEQNIRPTLTEHDAGLWVSYRGMRDLIAHRWPENTVGLDHVDKKIKQDYPENATRSFDHHNWLLLIVKPDAFELGVDQEVMERMRGVGFSVVASIVEVQLDETQVDQIWVPPQEKDPWYHATVEYMVRRPVDIHLLTGANATDSAKAVKQAMRTQYDRDHKDNPNAPVELRVESIIHCSDRMEELARQSVAFFGADQMLEISAGGHEYARA